jgi:hypothetical protein
VSTIAYRTDKLRQLDDDERRAWSTYHERVRDLSGEEYERAEDESWQDLQRKLRGLERRRRSLSPEPG